jgi:hypothetical protein
MIRRLANYICVIDNNTVEICDSHFIFTDMEWNEVMGKIQKTIK